MINAQPSLFADCRVAVLGGTAGVGLETASQFAERGAGVVLLGRDRERGAAACDKVGLRAPRGDVRFVRVDATTRTMRFGLSRSVGPCWDRSTCW